MSFAFDSDRPFAPLMVALLFLCSTVAAAQPQGQLLSAPDRRDYRLPAENQIQSAASIGGTTCAVWGTTRQFSPGVTADDLVLQIVRDSVPIGAPISVRSFYARPCGVVAVVPSNRTFLVLWNDRRASGAGVYARAFDTNGTVLGSEQRLSVGSIFGAPISIESNQGTSLITWNDTASATAGVWMLRIARNGMIDSVWSIPGNVRVVEALRYRFLPGSLLMFDSLGGGWFIDDRGRIDHRVPFNPGRRPFMLLEDSSVVTVTNGTLEFRASLFDSTIMRAVRHPGLDSALAGTVMLGRDSTGAIAIFYNVIWTVSTRVSRRIRRISVDNTGSPTGIREIASNDFDGFVCWSCPTYYLWFKDASSVRGCDNSVILNTRYESEDNQTRARDTSTWVSGIDESGGFVDDPGPTTLCPSIPASVPVVRTKSDTVSRIRLALSGPVSLAVPVAATGVPACDVRPMMLVSNGRIIAAWVSSADSIRLAAAIWDPETGALTRLPETTLKEGSPANVMGGSAPITRRSFYTADDEAVSFDGAGGYSRVYQRGDEFLVHYNSYHYEYYIAAGLRYYRPTGNGWRGIEPIRMQGESLAPQTWIETTASDPTSGSILIAVRHSPDIGPRPAIRSVLSIAPDAGVRWRVDNVATTMSRFSLVPLGVSEFMVIADSMFERWSAGALVASGRLDSVDTAARYHPMLGGRFISLASVESRLLIRRFDTAGRQTASVSLALDRDPRTLFILQNRLDSSLGLLWSAPDGIHGAFVTHRSLEVRIADTLLCAQGPTTLNPAGMFVHDTLAVVWQEKGATSFDVFGASVHIPGMVDTIDIRAGIDDHGSEPPVQPGESQVEGVQLSVGLYPNPADRLLSLSFNIPFRSDLTVEIYTMEGESVRRLELGSYSAGAHTKSIPLGGLASGVYMVRVGSEFRSSSTKLVIVPNP